jgi:hypothetical protein
MRTLKLIVPLVAAMVVSSCGDDPTGIVAGTQMSVGDQVAIEAALVKVADSLRKVGKTAADTALADYTRIAARLLRLHGREGTLSVTAPGSSTALSMRGAISHVSVPASVAPGGKGHTQILVAWEGLDNVALTIRNALVLAITSTNATGVYTLANSTGEAVRFVHMSAPFEFYSGTTGTVTIGAASFSGNCPGLVNTSAQSCSVGRETVAGSLTLARLGGGAGSVTWSDATLPAFELFTK